MSLTDYQRWLMERFDHACEVRMEFMIEAEKMLGRLIEKFDGLYNVNLEFDFKSITPINKEYPYDFRARYTLNDRMADQSARKVCDLVIYTDILAGGQDYDNYEEDEAYEASTDSDRKPRGGVEIYRDWDKSQNQTTSVKCKIDQCDNYFDEDLMPELLNKLGKRLRREMVEYGSMRYIPLPRP